MSESRKPNIAFIGNGLMGGPMARCLLREGFPLKVWNRTHSKAESLKELGATVLDSPSEAVKDAKVLITMLKDGPAVDEVVFRQGVATDLPPGSIHVDMGSIGLDQAVEHGERHAIRGIRYLDAPVSGGTKGAKAGDLAIMVGGDSETFAEVVPVFEAMGRPTHVGPTGCGQLSKLANQVIVAITIGAVSEAFILAGAGGADRSKVRDALQGGFASSRILSEHGLRMVNRDFEPGGPAKFQVKDLVNALRAAERLGLDLPITKLLHRLFEDMVQSGGAELDHAGLLGHLETITSFSAQVEDTD
ncbi:MAG: NAD(P)-dependent oxidoreductase [Opitutae bacterium]